MKQKRRLLALGLVAMMAVLAACTPKAPVETPAPTPKLAVNVAALNGPTGIGMVKMWNDAEQNGMKYDYQFTFVGAPDEIVGRLTSGEVDIAAVPINLAGALYNRTSGNVQTMALITRGVLYVVENGDSVKSLEDLGGKTLYATGQGSTPEFVIDYLLDKSEVDTTVEYKAEHAELAAQLISGDVKLAMLPEPFVTNVMSKNENVRIALDLNEQWRTVTADQGQETELSMSALVVRKEFAQQNPEAVADFLANYEESVNFVNLNIADAAALVEKAGIMPSAALAQKAIPNCNIVFIDGDEMKQAVMALYEVFFAANPQSIGGAMPTDGFFYERAD